MGGVTGWTIIAGAAADGGAVAGWASAKLVTVLVLCLRVSRLVSSTSSNREATASNLQPGVWVFCWSGKGRTAYRLTMVARVYMDEWFCVDMTRLIGKVLESPLPYNRLQSGVEVPLSLGLGNYDTLQHL